MNGNSDKKATIMCTITPSQVLSDISMVDAMHLAGMKSVRINTAHLDSVDQLDVIASKLKSKYPDIIILIDTKGPEMRTTSIADGATIQLTDGAALIIKGDINDKETTDKHVYVNYENINQDVSTDDVILIDDGKISLHVDAVVGEEIHATVVRGGLLGARKGLSIVGKDVNLPAVSQHDRPYIEYASKSSLIDLVAHSFVRSDDDVRDVRNVMGRELKPIIAKIENQQGIDNLERIIAEADGVLIARGDLSASIGIESVPAAQEAIAEAVKKAGKPLYLATNILPSMMNSAIASDDDIARINIALEQGIDVLLLTNETAVGNNPVETVEALNSAISEHEYHEPTDA